MRVPQKAIPFLLVLLAMGVTWGAMAIVVWLLLPSREPSRLLLSINLGIGIVNLICIALPILAWIREKLVEYQHTPSGEGPGTEFANLSNVKESLLDKWGGK